MMRRIYIHQQPDWPEFQRNSEALLAPLTECRYRQGLLLGGLSPVGFPTLERPALETLVNEVVSTSAIEGETLDAREVRSSLARRLGLEYAGVPVVDRRVAGVSAMMLDATRGYDEPVDAARLWRWHQGLFPPGVDERPTAVGAWRSTGSGAMRVVSRGRWGREQVHFVAPEPKRVPDEMTAFLDWFNAPSSLDPVLRAGLAHLWFVTIHPFEDGNGRIARAIAELALAQGDGSRERYYSMSGQIMRDRQSYYDVLETAQSGDLDVTEWLLWFVRCLTLAIASAEEQLIEVRRKAQRWQRWAVLDLNSRQRDIVNRLMDGFEGNFTTAKWAQIAKCSQDTALRDINGLVELGVLERSPAGGRSTKYALVND